MLVGTMSLERGMLRYSVLEDDIVLVCALTEELGVVCRLREFLPSRPLLLFCPTKGGILRIRYDYEDLSDGENRS